MSYRSIRFRLTVWYSLALAAGLTLFALTVWASMRQMLLRGLDRSLESGLESSRVFLKAELSEPAVHLSEELDEFSRGFPPGSYLQVAAPSGAIVFTSSQWFPWQSCTLPSKTSRIHWRNGSYLVRCETEIVNGGRWRIAVSVPLAETEALLDMLRVLLLMLIPMVVLIASVGGRWLSRRALKPVDEMTVAARSISAANLSARLAVPRTGDELERLAETWNSMLSRLEETVKRLSRFAADASHELRTPVAVIRTTAELANRKARTPEVYRDALQQIEAESERLTTLLEDLLLLARVDSDAVEMPKSVFDLGALVHDLCAQMKPLADAKSIRIAFEHASEGEILGNPDGIRRLIRVLLENAIKYSRVGEDVIVVLHRTGGGVSLEVVDSGPGIGEEELPLIFERFYRGPQSRQGPYEGSGLGLSLAAGIAQKNDAEIQVISSSGKGSTFRVLFRAAA